MQNWPVCLNKTWLHNEGDYINVLNLGLYCVIYGIQGFTSKFNFLKIKCYMYYVSQHIFDKLSSSIFYQHVIKKTKLINWIAVRRLFLSRRSSTMYWRHVLMVPNLWLDLPGAHIISYEDHTYFTMYYYVIFHTYQQNIDVGRWTLQRSVQSSSNSTGRLRLQSLEFWTFLIPDQLI